MGIALIAKPALNRRFSIVTFGIAQVVMDIEPGIRMWASADVLHGPTHSILGALILAFLVMQIAPSICNYLVAKWNKEVSHYKQPWLLHSDPVSKSAVAFGALFGTLSHLVLDSLIHHDIHPLSPFLAANPLSDLVTHDGVYQACTIMGVVGIAAWLAAQCTRHYRTKLGKRHGA